MITGLDDGVANDDCTLPSCLLYKADAGNRWAYHNAAYTLLDKVIEKASGTSYNNYYQQKIRDKIGMNGLWIKPLNSNNVLYSYASSMVPTLQTIFPASIIPNAPADMYAALGKNDQKIYVVPSQKLVVTRMGESAGSVQFAVSGFDNELWGKLKTFIKF
jgi:CubicO group peptidase (beta-lactamase class C family)